MSNRIDFVTQIKDLNLLKQALNLMSRDLMEDPNVKLKAPLKLQKDMTIRRYQDNTEDCQYGIKLEGLYDLGLDKDTDGYYKFVADDELLNPDKDYSNRGKKGRSIVGTQGGKLLQYYFLAKQKKESQGQLVTYGFEEVTGDILIDTHVGIR